MKKRISSLLAVLALCLLLLPTAALATGDATEDTAAAAVVGTDGVTDYYATFDAAFDAAKKGDTIKLLANVSNESKLTIAAGRSLTIDLNGYKLNYYFTVSGTLTLTNSNQTKAQTARTITVSGGKLILSGSLNVNDESGDAGVILGDTTHAGTLEILSGNVFVPILVVVNPGDTKLTCGKFRAMNTAQADITISALLADGYAFKNTDNVAIDGTINTREYSAGTISVGAHTHSFTLSEGTKCRCGFSCTHELKDGYCSKCKTQVYAAMVGNTCYQSFAAARSAVSSGAASGDIKLLCDLTGMNDISSGTFTIDLNGHTITNTKELQISSGAALTLKNGSFLSSADYGIHLYGSSGLTLGEKMTVKGSTYAVYCADAATSLTLSADTVLLGGLYNLAHKLGDYLPSGTMFVSCGVDGAGSPIRPTAVTAENSLLSINSNYCYQGNLAVVSHASHSYDEKGLCPCGVSAAAKLQSTGSTVYATITAAFEAAQDVDTVTLLAAQTGSASEPVTVPAGKSLTIDLDEKTLVSPVTVLGTLTLKGSGTAQTVTLGEGDTCGTLVMGSGDPKVQNLTVNKYDGTLKLQAGRYQNISIDTDKNPGVTVGTLLPEGYGLYSGTTGFQPVWSSTSCKSNTELTIKKCGSHGGWQDGLCGYCGKPCTHENVEDNGCTVCGKGVVACIFTDDHWSYYYYADLNRAVDYIQSLNRSETLYLTATVENASFTVNGAWSLYFRTKGGASLVSGLPDSHITIEQGGILDILTDSDSAVIGTVTVKSGGRLETSMAQPYYCSASFTSVTVEEGASADLIAGTFGKIENKGGCVGDLLAEGYAFANKDSGEIVSCYKDNITSLQNVRIVQHSHTISAKGGDCACGFQCDHTAGYLNGVCTGCGTRCPHPADKVEGNKCNACNADLCATLTTGGVTSYFSDLNYAFSSVPANSNSTITLLQDARLGGVSTNSVYGLYGTPLGNPCSFALGSTVTLDMAGYSISDSPLLIGSDSDTSAVNTLILTGKGDVYGSVTLLGSGRLETNNWNGRMSYLVFSGDCRNQALLKSGEFDLISCANGASYKTGELMPAGLVFQKADGSFLKRSYTIETSKTVKNIKIVECPHPELDGDNGCAYCDATGFTATVTAADGTLCAYKDLQTALDRANGGTVKLLTSADSLSVSSGLTLDLNGCAVTALTVNTAITLRDSAAVKGTIGSLTVAEGLTLGALPEEGYALWTDKDSWLSNTAVFASNVTVRQAPIRLIDAESSVTKAYGDADASLSATVTMADGNTDPYDTAWSKVTDGSATTLETDGLSYALPADLAVGTYTYRLTVTSGGYSVTHDFTVTVNKAKSTGEPEYEKISAVGKTLADANLTIGSITPADGTLSWDDGDTTSVECGKSYSWTFTPTDSANYETLTGSIVLWEKSGDSGSIVIPVNPTENGNRYTEDEDENEEIDDNARDFIDTADHWAKDSIDFVSARGLMIGVSATKFAPDAPATRAQLWMILARQAGADVTGGDVWYEKAQAWVMAAGISDGRNPNAIVTRAQMVTMLWRAAGSPTARSASSFTDVPADAYYAQAVAWAEENGITVGIGGGLFGPDAACTRAQIATFLRRSMR